MRVLVACEFSGVVREAFRARGCQAVSCDLEPSWRPGPHIRGDVRAILNQPWDLMIAHPPCTYLCASGRRYAKERVEDTERALEFVRLLLEAPIPRIALENPVGVISSRIRPPDQYVQPWWFGHPETKKTGLWLKGLPRLHATNPVEPTEGSALNRLGETKMRSHLRSITYWGLAQAMAAQWGH